MILRFLSKYLYIIQNFTEFDFLYIYKKIYQNQIPLPHITPFFHNFKESALRDTEKVQRKFRESSALLLKYGFKFL